MHTVLSFADLYPTIRRTVHALLAGQPIADDITQEAALRALVLWYRFSPPPGTTDVARARRRWAATVALHVVQEWRAAAGAHKRTAEIVIEPDKIDFASRAWPPSGEALAIHEETLRELGTATTPERWQAFYMRHVEGFTASQIATAMGARVNTVYTWIRHAADDLRAYLARRDAAHRRRG